MRKLMVLGLLSAGLMGSVTSCATVFKGDKQNVAVASNPSGAEITVNGISYGQTPVQLNLKTNQSYTIVVRKDGKEKTYVLNNRIGTLWIVLDIVTGLVPVIVDAATGAWYEFDTSSVNIDLR